MESLEKKEGELDGLGIGVVDIPTLGCHCWWLAKQTLRLLCCYDYQDRDDVLAAVRGTVILSVKKVHFLYSSCSYDAMLVYTK